MSRASLELADSAASTGWRRRFGRPGRVVRRGVLGSAIAPLAGAVGVLVLVAGLAAIGGNWWAGYSREQSHARAVQPDGSVAAIATGTPLVETATVMVRDLDGEVRRLVVERSAADRFVNDTLRRLDTERQRLKAAASADVATVFALAFADAEAAVDRHADWFFAFERPYVVLGRAIVSTSSRLLQLGAYEPLQVAVGRDLEDYFMARYQAQVLRPEHREPLLARGFEEAARRAHGRWLEVVAEQDLRFRLFLAEHTVLDPLPTDQRLSVVVLDWDAQRFKAPRHLAAEQAFDGLVGVATVVGGGVAGGAVAGAVALRPALARASRPIFAGLGQRFAGAFAGRLAMAQTGAAMGSAVQPVGGTALGAVAGGILGLAADYALNEADAVFNRESFVAANHEALDLTRTLWEERLTETLEAAIDRWFDDTRAAVVQAD
jgi:hypothetical protein